MSLLRNAAGAAHPSSSRIVPARGERARARLRHGSRGCARGAPAQLRVAVEEAQAAAGDAELVCNGLHASGG